MRVNDFGMHKSVRQRKEITGHRNHCYQHVKRLQKLFHFQSLTHEHRKIITVPGRKELSVGNGEHAHDDDSAQDENKFGSWFARFGSVDQQAVSQHNQCHHGYRARAFISPDEAQFERYKTTGFSQFVEPGVVANLFGLLFSGNQIHKHAAQQKPDIQEIKQNRKQKEHNCECRSHQNQIKQLAQPAGKIDDSEMIDGKQSGKGSEKNKKSVFGFVEPPFQVNSQEMITENQHKNGQKPCCCC